MVEINNLKFKCGFCGEVFNSCSECAKHIENESHVNICFPHDIKVMVVDD